MIVKKNPLEILLSLEETRKELEIIIEVYLESYADYGWDSFTEDLANISAQLCKDEILLKNAEVGSRYNI